MKLLLLGGPGSGKGTQGERLADRLGIEHVSSGEALRAEVARGSEVGRRVAGYLDRGELVPDDVVVEVVKPVVSRAARAHGYLLDGFPRNLAQAKALDTALAREGIAPDAAIYLDVPEDELRRRLLARARTEHRSDDTPEIIDHRLEVFREATQPIVDHYRGRGQLIAVAGDRPPDDVTGDLMTALSDLPRTLEQQ
jgi:adenylate kinase